MSFRTTFGLDRAGLLASTALLLLAPVLAPASHARVGVTSATDGDPVGKPPSENERILRIGIDVQANEVIRTAEKDRAHLVFLDGTALTVGPNAQLTIDKFVYDPATKTGELAMTASKGVFRLVGGKISKDKPITIATPSSTIGIRGGITIFTVTATQTTSSFVFGTSMTVTGQGQTQTATRPGSQIVSSAGAAPSPPALAGAGAFNSSLSQLEGGSTGQGGSGSGGSGASGGSGGTGGTGIQNLANVNSNTNPPAGNTPPSAPPPTNNNPATNAVSNSNDQTQPKQADTPPPPPPPPPETTTTIIMTRGRYMADPTITSFDAKTLKAPRDPVNNQVLMPTGTLDGSTGKATITTGDGSTAQFSVDWKPGQLGYPVTANGGQLTGYGAVSADGTFFGFILTDVTTHKQTAIFGGTPTPLASFPTSGAASYVLVNGRDFFALPFVPGANPTVEQAASVSKLLTIFSQNLSATPTPGVSPNQSAASLQVTVSISGAGVIQRSYMGAYIGNFSTDYATNTIMNSGKFIGSYRANGTGQIDRLYSNQVTAQTPDGNAIYGTAANTLVFVPDSARTTIGEGGPITTRTDKASLEQPYPLVPAGTGYVPVTIAVKQDAPLDLGTRTTRTMNGFVGGTIETRDESGNFSTRLLNTSGSQASDVTLTTDASANRAQGTIMVRNFGGGVDATFQLGSTTGSSLSDSAFIGDTTYGMRDHTRDPNRRSSVTDGETTTSIKSRTVLVSYGSAPLQPGQTLPGGVTPCACEFMTWGWWSGNIDYNKPGYRQGESDRLHMATYVAGTLSNVVQLPNTGSASFSGHAIGNVLNGTKSYIAAGSYLNSWSWATQTGAVSISNFDGATYAGTTALQAGTVQFSGPLAGAGRTGSLNGAFVSAPGVPVAGQMGNFSVQGPGYQAGGTFAAKKVGP